MNIALLFGGPSLERGISLNSARSVLDHLSSEEIKITPIYFDWKKKPWLISPSQLYSNTPSDFDFKLSSESSPLPPHSLVNTLKKTDIAFPVIHGKFGEDGGIQRFLENHRIPFVGTPSSSAKLLFDKYSAHCFLKKNNFFTLPSLLLKISEPASVQKKNITTFFRQNEIRRAIVKPARGGSSIGVFSVENPEEALEKARGLFNKRMDTRLVVEPFAEGVEFTVILLENEYNQPVALIPTEIESDYAEHQIFDFRRKYLPTRQVAYHCPPRFPRDIIEKIQIQAEQLFSLFGMRDMARFDGWILSDGSIFFSDFNPVSGMEQNSFLFQQASRIGMTHADVLHFVVKHACKRHNIPFPNKKNSAQKQKKHARVRPVSLIFGGSSSERHVSLMSGTNVWLKLRNSGRFSPSCYLLGTDHTVWHVPYHLLLNHTVEEIEENCKKEKEVSKRLRPLEDRARMRLSLPPKCPHEFFNPSPQSISQFVAKSKSVFIALHGGIGEDGTIQRMLEKASVPFNGSSSSVSAVCIDKWKTRIKIEELCIPGVAPIPGVLLSLQSLQSHTNEKLQAIWRKIKKELGAKTLIAKPRTDGCSSGVAHLTRSGDFSRYISWISSSSHRIPAGTFAGQLNPIELPLSPPNEIIMEQHVATDTIRIRGNCLLHSRTSGWIEITIGVVERNGSLHALSPSITIAEGDVLSVEEKFQGGTGVNLTPPPASLCSARVVSGVKKKIERLARAVGISGYARIDAFMHCETGNLLIIEINTLPALTPSTVLFHQALAENPPVFPKQFLESLVRA